MLEDENKPVETDAESEELTEQDNLTAENFPTSEADAPVSDVEEQETTQEEACSAASSEEPTDKIAAIKTTLFQIAKEEEEESVSLRVAYQIRQVKERKEHPEKFPPPPPRRSRSAKPKKRSFGQKIADMFPQKGDSASEVVRKSVFLLSAAVFLVCLVLIAIYFIDIFRTNALYEDIGSAYHATLAETTTTATEEVTEETETETEKIYTLLPGAEELLAMNDEINGWITIPDTKVDYPVLHHLDDEPGNEYYLYRNVQKEDSKPGSIFLDYRCSFDQVGEDGTLETPNSDNLIIYGHNMRDLSMFGTLKYYKSDENYYEEHPIIELHSNYETYQYKIFAYFIADAEDTTDTRFEYWNAINFADETEFYDYVNEVKRRTLRITNVDVEYGDSLLTLSTCNSVFDTARLVIVARRVRDGEDPNERIVGSYTNPNIKWPSVYYLWNKDTYDPDAPFVPYG